MTSGAFPIIAILILPPGSPTYWPERKTYTPTRCKSIIMRREALPARIYFLRCKKREKSIKITEFLSVLVSYYARKYDTTQRVIKASISTMVAWCIIFSGPRRSNFQKSFEFGTIERPDHFDCNMTIPIMRRAMQRRRVDIELIISKFLSRFFKSCKSARII